MTHGGALIAIGLWLVTVPICVVLIWVRLDLLQRRVEELYDRMATTEGWTDCGGPLDRAARFHSGRGGVERGEDQQGHRLRAEAARKQRMRCTTD